MIEEKKSESPVSADGLEFTALDQVPGYWLWSSQEIEGHLRAYKFIEPAAKVALKLRLDLIDQMEAVARRELVVAWDDAEVLDQWLRVRALEPTHDLGPQLLAAGLDRPARPGGLA